MGYSVHYLAIGLGSCDHLAAAAGVSEVVEGFLGGALQLLLHHWLEEGVAGQQLIGQSEGCIPGRLQCRAREKLVS